MQYVLGSRSTYFKKKKNDDKPKSKILLWMWKRKVNYKIEKKDSKNIKPVKTRRPQRIL